MTARALLMWRNRLGLSQTQAAAALNVPLGTYRNWEQDVRRVPGAVEMLCKYIERYGALTD
jgi:DNA-binding transcriptional regulator YiaG